MAEFWSFSGVNSWRPDLEQYDDYVWAQVGKTIKQEPARHYVSHLGTGSHYKDRGTSIISLKSETKLNDEAIAFAAGRKGDHGAIRGKFFKGKQVRCLLIAPKTGTQPPTSSLGLVVEIYWSPEDPVPNQGFLEPDSLSFWRRFARGGGHVRAVKNRQGHALKGFVTDPLKIVRRIRRRNPGSSNRFHYAWIPTGETIPDPLRIVKDWLKDPNVDYVMVGHSQGTNIAMHVLSRGLGA